MKYFISFLTILTALFCNAQTIKQGDNLITEFKKISKPYYFEAPGFSDWAEGKNMMFIGDKPDPNSCEFVFIALQDTTLIGVFTMKEPNVFMADMDGTSILGSPSDIFVLPAWAVKRRTRVLPADKTIYEVLDKLCEETLQANDGMPELETAKKYQQFRTDTTLANRHIALLFDNYQYIVSETAAKGQTPPANICVPLMKALMNECSSLYNSIPAIVYISMGEALVSAGMTDEARSHFKKALQVYPNSIPVLVYNYRLEQDQQKKKEQLKDLKKKYPEHWMVKDL